MPARTAPHCRSACARVPPAHPPPTRALRLARRAAAERDALLPLSLAALWLREDRRRAARRSRSLLLHAVLCAGPVPQRCVGAAAARCALARPGSTFTLTPKRCVCRRHTGQRSANAKLWVRPSVLAHGAACVRARRERPRSPSRPLLAGAAILGCMLGRGGTARWAHASEVTQGALKSPRWPEREVRRNEGGIADERQRRHSSGTRGVRSSLSRSPRLPPETEMPCAMRCAPADLFLPASCRRPACAKNGSTDDQGHLALAHPICRRADTTARNEGVKRSDESRASRERSRRESERVCMLCCGERELRRLVWAQRSHAGGQATTISREHTRCKLLCTAVMSCTVEAHPTETELAACTAGGVWAEARRPSGAPQPSNGPTPPRVTLQSEGAGGAGVGRRI